MVEILEGILLKLGFEEKDARLIAETHTQSSCDGVESHGLNRFPRFVEYVRAGYVRIGGQMKLLTNWGALERWDGQQRAGILNAHQAMERAITLAKIHGLGAVALSNTNHWMRGGTYGWKAAEQQCMAICMTNTIPNMAPWGGEQKIIGNNPIIFAVPSTEGHIVLDMATSQYSYGKMEDAVRKGDSLPYYGGWDESGVLTRDPEAILKSGRVLPAGMWKGSGLTILIDLMVSLLSGGESSHEIGQRQYETNLSQLFLCIDAAPAQSESRYQDEINAIIHSLQLSLHDKEKVFYPGERTLARRKINMELGIPADPEIWNEILALRG